MVGVRNVDKVQNDFLSVVGSGQKLNRPVDIEAELAETDGGILLLFTVGALLEALGPKTGPPAGFRSGIRPAHGPGVPRERQGRYGGTGTEGPRGPWFPGGTSPACDGGRRWWTLVARRAIGGRWRKADD